MTEPKKNEHELVDEEVIDDPFVERRVPVQRQQGVPWRDWITPDEWIALLPRNEKTTVWRNTTSTPVSFLLQVRTACSRSGRWSPIDIPQIDNQLVLGPGSAKVRLGDMDDACNVWCARGRTAEGKPIPITLRPGETIELPRSVDQAILDIRNGQIIGGLAPQLRPVGRAVNAVPARIYDSREQAAAVAADLERKERGGS